MALVEPSVDIQTEESDNEEQEINNLRRTKQEIEFDYEEYIKKFVCLKVFFNLEIIKIQKKDRKAFLSSVKYNLQSEFEAFK